MNYKEINGQLTDEHGHTVCFDCHRPPEENTFIRCKRCYNKYCGSNHYPIKDKNGVTI